MPYFRFTLIYEGAFAARLVPGRDGPVVDPKIRDIFLSDLRALNVRLPATSDQIRIHEAGAISHDFWYDQNGHGVRFIRRPCKGPNLTFDRSRGTDSIYRWKINRT